MLHEGIVVVLAGSDNHMLLDVRPFGLNGRKAETALESAGYQTNAPFDPNGPWYTSGLRIGTPAITTLGMKEEEMKEVAAIIKLVLENTKPTIITKGERSGEQSLARAVTTKEARDEARKRVQALLDRFVLYPELDLELMRAYRQQ